MHTAISREVARTRIADWRRQAERDALAHSVVPAPSTSPRATRKRIPVRLPGWLLRQPA